MTEVYSTQELIEILERERQACLKGERLNLNATPFIGNSAIDRWLKPDAVQKFAAYQDFKTAIHRYQQQHQVSGIVWRHICVNGETLRYPQVDDRLIALPSDIEILKGAKASIWQFWDRVTAEMDLYLSVHGGKDYQLVTVVEVKALDRRTEWANLWKWEREEFLEIVLQLGWGQPHDSYYRRGSLSSGSEYVHAVRSGKRPIG
ncbi:MAG: hypothetical protein D6728_19340 [Cyanobacteria bacterium J055]|nr:MAG: hypothetical protein D6728_19340 [Cyanobacteria bacterium J055]